MVAGVLVASGSTIVEVLTVIDAKWGQAAGAVIAVVGALLRAATDLGYIRARATVKAATAEGAAKVAVAEVQAAGQLPHGGQTP